MRLFKKTEFNSLPGRPPFFGVQRIIQMLSRQRRRRKAEKNRRELLKLGRHLLRDLGFDSQGYPLEAGRRLHPPGKKIFSVSVVDDGQMFFQEVKEGRDRIRQRNIGVGEEAAARIRQWNADASQMAAKSP